MVRIVGMKIKGSGKACDFDAGRLELNSGDNCIVEIEKGVFWGEVVVKPTHENNKNYSKGKLGRVLRKATPDDFGQLEKNKELEGKSYKVCLKKIHDCEIAMKLVSVEYAFDGTKAVFYFTADGRVDFRELVKDLAYEFKTRIEMRQIGVRDEAKMIGGFGPCGRVLCCTSFLKEFEPVSIRMAKEQELPLNPSKISGVCGRLMCCLSYEHETYGQIRKKMPKIGREFITQQGKGVVKKYNLLEESFVVKLDEGKEITVKLKEMEKKENDSTQ